MTCTHGSHEFKGARRLGDVNFLSVVIDLKGVRVPVT
jgi:hypothetical protein